MSEIRISLSDIEYYIEIEKWRASSDFPNNDYGNKRLAESIRETMNSHQSLVDKYKNMLRVLELTTKRG